MHSVTFRRKTFSSFIFDGNFRGRGTVYVSRAVAHLQGVVLGPENHTKTGFVPRCLHSMKGWCVRSPASETCEKKVPFKCFCFGKGF